MGLHRFLINGAAGDYQTVLDIVAVFGPARAVFYRVKAGSSPAAADVVTAVLWSGDVIDVTLDDASATRPLVTALLTDLPMAVVGHIAGIAV